MFKDKTVLITGGTGFLGRALSTEILKYQPKSLRIFSRDELKHHKYQELFGNADGRIRNLIGDVRDYERLKKSMEGVDIVIHAAAAKRIDILEYNVEESIKTNILGSVNVVNACLDKFVEKAIFVSSDKACSPVNTYGACKFVSERIFTESNYNKGNKKTIFTCVRYGNVLESTGSVIPFFEEKIKNGEIIPLTDEKMTRFIITPDQAVNLIFNSIEFGVGGEIFIPKLKSLKITDLIEALTQKYKTSPKIKLVGLRPGEKIHEVLINESEIQRSYDFKDMYIIQSEIEKYQDLPNKPKYVTEGMKLNETVIKEYCSNNYLISKEQILNTFKKLKLL